MERASLESLATPGRARAIDERSGRHSDHGGAGRRAHQRVPTGVAPLSPTAGSQKANCDGGNLLSRSLQRSKNSRFPDLRLYRDRAAHLVAGLKSNGAAEVRGPSLSSRLGDLRGSADTPTCSLISQRVAWGCREPQLWRLPWHLRRACVGSAPPRTTKY